MKTRTRKRADGTIVQTNSSRGGRADDPTLDQLKSIISELSVDEQIDLVALAWLGRDEYPDNWEQVCAEASEAHNEHTADYLCGNPLLGNHLSVCRPLG